MLARRKPKPMTERPQTVFPRHQKFVRGFVCIVPNCATGDKIQCCHVRVGLPWDTPDWARGGTQKKPHDCFTHPGCVTHHIEQGNIGEHTFAEKYGIDPLKESRALALASPDPEVRGIQEGIERMRERA